jgi:hypothetical protein
MKKKAVMVIKSKRKYPRDPTPLAIEPDTLRGFVTDMVETAHENEAKERSSEKQFEEGEGVDWPVGSLKDEDTK